MNCLQKNPTFVSLLFGVFLFMVSSSTFAQTLFVNLTDISSSNLSDEKKNAI